MHSLSFSKKHSNYGSRRVSRYLCTSQYSQYSQSRDRKLTIFFPPRRKMHAVLKLMADGVTLTLWGASMLLSSEAYVSLVKCRFNPLFCQNISSFLEKQHCYYDDILYINQTNDRADKSDMCNREAWRKWLEEEEHYDTHRGLSVIISHIHIFFKHI